MVDNHIDSIWGRCVHRKMQQGRGKCQGPMCLASAWDFAFLISWISFNWKIHHKNSWYGIINVSNCQFKTPEYHGKLYRMLLIMAVIKVGLKSNTIEQFTQQIQPFGIPNESILLFLKLKLKYKQYESAVNHIFRSEASLWIWSFFTHFLVSWVNTFQELC